MVGEKKAMLTEEGKEKIEEQGSSQSRIFVNSGFRIRLPVSRKRKLELVFLSLRMGKLVTKDG